MAVILSVLLCALLPGRDVLADSGSKAFISQSAAVSSSTLRGLLSDITADVRGPASSYTLTIDSISSGDMRSLLTDSGIRYNLIECYDLSLTAVGSKTISRNPQFGDVTITIPLGSSMDPDKGTFAVYTTDADGELEKLSCTVIYGTSTTYAVKFLTIHFSAYAIVYTSGGSTRVYGQRPVFSGAGVSGADTAQDTADDALNNEQDTVAADDADTGDAADEALADEADSGDDADAAPADDTGKDENGDEPYIYDNPKTGDRRYYGTLTAAIIVTLTVFILIARSKKRVS